MLHHILSCFKIFIMCNHSSAMFIIFHRFVASRQFCTFFTVLLYRHFHPFSFSYLLYLQLVSSSAIIIFDHLSAMFIIFVAFVIFIVCVIVIIFLFHHHDPHFSVALLWRQPRFHNCTSASRQKADWAIGAPFSSLPLGVRPTLCG